MTDGMSFWDKVLSFHGVLTRWEAEYPLDFYKGTTFTKVSPQDLITFQRPGVAADKL